MDGENTTADAAVAVVVNVNVEEESERELVDKLGTLRAEQEFEGTNALQQVTLVARESLA